MLSSPQLQHVNANITWATVAGSVPTQENLATDRFLRDANT